MKGKEFYVLWQTRNGQKLWDGPFASQKAAWGALNMTIEGSNGFILSNGFKAWKEPRDRTPDS